MAQTFAVAPPVRIRLLGLIGALGGLALIAAFVPQVPWSREWFQLRLVLYNAGAIAVTVAIVRQAPAPRWAIASGAAVVLANAWYLAMVVLSVDRPQPPDPDPAFRLVMFYAGAAMWWTDALFGLAAWHTFAANRWGALALGLGSVLAFTGIDRLELVRGDAAWLFVPAALIGIALNGIGWIVLGVDVALRRRPVRVPERTLGH